MLEIESGTLAGGSAEIGTPPPPKGGATGGALNGRLVCAIEIDPAPGGKPLARNWSTSITASVTALIIAASKPTMYPDVGSVGSIRPKTSAISCSRGCKVARAAALSRMRASMCRHPWVWRWDLGSLASKSSSAISFRACSAKAVGKSTRLLDVVPACTACALSWMDPQRNQLFRMTQLKEGARAMILPASPGCLLANSATQPSYFG